MKILSIFDGISGCRLSLDNLNLSPEKYYAVENNKCSVKVASTRYPDNIYLPDISLINKIEHSFLFHHQIDLMIVGNPVNYINYSPLSQSLLFHILRLHYLIKPKYFLYEDIFYLTFNSKKFLNNCLKTKPIFLNSNLFVPQNRKHFYWTNISDVFFMDYISKPSLDDILIDGICCVNNDDKFNIDNFKSVKVLCYNNFDLKKCNENISVLVKDENGKFCFRKLHPVEMERLNGYPDDYTSPVEDEQRYNVLSNCTIVPIAEYFLKHIKMN